MLPFFQPLMVQMMAPLFLDPKRRVRQACLESLAILAQIMGPSNTKTIYDTVSGQDFGRLFSTLKTFILLQVLILHQAIMIHQRMLSMQYLAEFQEKFCPGLQTMATWNMDCKFHTTFTQGMTNFLLLSFFAQSFD